MDDDIHFRNEERKEKKNRVGWRGGRKKQPRRRGRGRKKMLRLAPIKAGGGGRRVFSLTPGSSGDRRLCMRMCVRVRVFMCVCTGSSVSISWGRGRTWEKALVARKKQPAVLKQYQLHGNRQGDRSTTQSNKGKKTTTRKETKCNAAMRAGRKKERTEGGNEGEEEKDLSLFFFSSGEEDGEKAGEECEGER